MCLRKIVGQILYCIKFQLVAINESSKIADEFHTLFYCFITNILLTYLPEDSVPWMYYFFVRNCYYYLYCPITI